MIKIVELNQKEIISVAGGCDEKLDTIILLLTGITIGGLMGALGMKYLTNDSIQKLSCIEQCIGKCFNSKSTTTKEYFCLN
jgi:hypothetical protein